MYLLCIGASRGFAFVEFNATQEAARWMEMKQVERSSVQIPMPMPSTAPWRQGTVTQPSGPPRGHGCAPIKNIFFNISYSNYLSRNLSPPPQYFCRHFLNSLSLNIFARYIYWIGLSLRFTHTHIHNFWDSVAARAFTCPLSIIKVRGLTMKIGGGSFQSFHYT